MNLKYKFWFSIFLLVGQLGISNGEGKAKPEYEQHQKQEIATVSYCDLVRNQASYAGKLLRVKAIVLFWLDGTSLYDAGCKDQGLEPIFDCKDKEQCSLMREILDKKTDYNGDVGRVEAVLTGKLVVSRSASLDKARSKFMIKTIKQVTRVSRGVPWPG